MIHQRLKSRVEIFRFVRQHLAASFVREGLNVDVERVAELTDSRGPNHDAIFDRLVVSLGNDAADDAARFKDRVRGRFAG